MKVRAIEYGQYSDAEIAIFMVPDDFEFRKFITKEAQALVDEGERSDWEIGYQVYARLRAEGFEELEPIDVESCYIIPPAPWVEEAMEASRKHLSSAIAAVIAEDVPHETDDYEGQINTVVEGA